MPTLIATWSPARGVWETTGIALCGHSVPYSETWPPSGTTRGGYAYLLPSLAPPTLGCACSSPPGLLPTPAAADGTGGRTELEVGGHRASGSKRSIPLPTAVALLPTPTPSNPNDGQELGSFRARQERLAAKGYNGNGASAPLAIAVQLLPTPRATDAEKGSPGQTATEGGPSLPAVAATLLPTPVASDANGTVLPDWDQSSLRRTVARLSGESSPPPSSGGNTSSAAPPRHPQPAPSGEPCASTPGSSSG